MIWFKACPRCNGDLYLDGDEVACLMCGYRRDIKILRSDGLHPRLARSREKIGIAKRKAY